MSSRFIAILLAAVFLTGCNIDSSVEFEISGTVKTAEIEHFAYGTSFHQAVVTLPHTYRTSSHSGAKESFTVQSPLEKGNLSLKVFVDGKLVSSDYATTPSQDIQVQLKLPHNFKRTARLVFWLMAFCFPLAWWFISAFDKDTNPKPPDQFEGLPFDSDDRKNSRARYLARVRDAVRRVE